MNYFFKISKSLNFFVSRNSKTRLMKNSLKLPVFKQLIASIAFQMMLPLTDTLQVLLLDIVSQTITPCFQCQKLCPLHLIVYVDQEYLQVLVFFCFCPLLIKKDEQQMCTFFFFLTLHL